MKFWPSAARRLNKGLRTVQLGYATAAYNRSGTVEMKLAPQAEWSDIFKPQLHE